MIGKMWGWLQEDNERVNITGVRWLVMDEAMNSCKAVTLLRMGRRVYRTTRYDWNRRGGAKRVSKVRDQYTSRAMTTGEMGRRRQLSKPRPKTVRMLTNTRGISAYA